MKKIIIAISMMLAMNIFLAVPALAENYQEYGLYDSDGNYKGMFYSIEEINDFLCINNDSRCTIYKMRWGK